MKKRLLPLLLLLALLAGCAGAPAAEPAKAWVPEETPEAREERILATCELLQRNDSDRPGLSQADSVYDWLTAYCCVLLTAREP